MAHSGEELTERARRFEALVLAHRGAVRSYALRRVPAEHVDDVLAETFLVAWRRLESVPDSSPLPWLLGVARNVIATQERAAGRREALTARLMEQSASFTPDTVRTNELSANVVEALAALTQRDREALLLIAWEGLSSGDAARVLGELPSAFYVHLHRAKRRFKRLLEQHELEGADEQSARVLEAKETIP